MLILELGTLLKSAETKKEKPKGQPKPSETNLLSLLCFLFSMRGNLKPFPANRSKSKARRTTRHGAWLCLGLAVTGAALRLSEGGLGMKFAKVFGAKGPAFSGGLISGVSKV